MRFLTFILCLQSVLANAATYYVSNSGSNSNSGTSTASSWQTLSKVISSVAKKDSVFLKKGDVWNEKFFIPVDSLYIGSYGTGNKPIITALQNVSLSNTGNIWTATVNNAPSGLNTVLVNGAIRAKARYPNTGYLTYNRTYTNSSRVVGSLTGFPDYTGAEIVVKTTAWDIDNSKITGQVGDTFSVSPALNNVSFGTGYFIKNTLQVLDTLNEWVFNGSTKALSVYATTLPSVQVSVLDTLVYVNGKTGVTIDGVYLSGANAYNILCNSSHYFSFINSTITNSGANAIMLNTSNYVTITGDSIVNSLNAGIISGVLINQLCNNNLIQNNYIYNTTPFAGMGYSNSTNDGPILIHGNASNVINNQVIKSGYQGIRYAGKKCLIKNNYIDSFCILKDDGGGIYTYIGNYYPADYSDSSIVRGNIILNGIGNNEAVLYPNTAPSAGIYMDNYSRRQTIDSNTIYNTVVTGINFNQSNENQVHDNNIMYVTRPGLIYTQDAAIYLANNPCTGHNISRNVFYSDGKAALFRGSSTDLAPGNTIDSNYYITPSTAKVQTTSASYTLASWQAASSYDIHSTSALPAYATTPTPILAFNKTSSSIFSNIGGSYTDVFGKIYYGTTILSPFKSKLLFPTSIPANQTIIGGFKYYK